jgi:transposase-like protein
MIFKLKMTTDTDKKTKGCPCCLKTKLVETGKFIVSRSKGKNTSTWKCAECLAHSKIKKTSPRL